MSWWKLEADENAKELALDLERTSSYIETLETMSAQITADETKFNQQVKDVTDRFAETLRLYTNFVQQLQQEIPPVMNDVEVMKKNVENMQAAIARSSTAALTPAFLAQLTPFISNVGS